MGFKTRHSPVAQLFIEHDREVATSLADTNCDVADWHEASMFKDRSDFRCWGESRRLLEIVTWARLTLCDIGVQIPIWRH